MLEVKGLTFAYDERHILKDLTLFFKEHQITGILGANGSGKSTLMKLMTKLLKPRTGTICLDGHTIGHSKKEIYHYRQEVNMVLQDPEQQLFYAIVEDDVALALRNLDYSDQDIEKRVSRALEQMDISHLRYEPVHYLSYGQKKRVAIAGMLALEPRYLLLDEPTAGLDPKGRSKMMLTMKKLVASGTSIIISSHDMDLMYDCCDFAYLLSDGALIGQGDKYDLFQKRDLLEEADLGIPWVVKLHQSLGTPLAHDEESFFKEFSGGKKW
ncbi:energy-coupling factor ABC transporter ATP-binding protein [Streptococcus catagoni]|uniref:energy-coupling factor ABC transporter ATP-binding protein n=1 Tax=Streptococcus catagoni TaxID=2654874 RepID=UPI00140D11AE|nr:ATP-binding cassette domain-containing protein [Streptococcus catagoni]